MNQSNRHTLKSSRIVASYVRFCVMVAAVALVIEAYAQEVGNNDFRISQAGTDGVTTVRVDQAEVCYNATANEFFVVFDGDATGTDAEDEIWGRRVNAATGAPIGSDIRISHMGPDANADYDAWNPDVAWDSTSNQYLVVWAADDNSGSLVDNEFEIWGEILSGTGTETVAQFRISTMGADGDANIDALYPAVAYGATQDEFMVVWTADDTTASADETYGRRVSNAGVLLGSQFQVSTMGATASDTAYRATNPYIAWGSTQDEFFVVWTGDDDSNGLADNEYEVFGRFVQSDGTLVGADDIQVSALGGANGTNTNYTVLLGYGGVAYNATDDEFLTVWCCDDNDATWGAWADGEIEVAGQRFSAATHAEVGSDDFRITNVGTNGNANSTDEQAEEPSVAWDSANNRYLVCFRQKDVPNGQASNELEAGIQMVSNTGALVNSRMRVSDMQGVGNTNGFVESVKVAYGSTSGRFLVIWDGDDNVAPQVDGEFEVWGQLLEASSLPVELSQFILE